MGRALATVFTFLLIVSSWILVRGTWHLYANNQDWISSMIGASGNIAGGVIGGFVALWVARYQISTEKRSEMNKEKLEFRTSLLMFVDDIDHSIRTIQAIVDSKEIDEELVLMHLQLSSWEVIRSLCIRHLSQELYMKCNRLKKQFDLIQLLVKTKEITIDEFQALQKRCTNLKQDITNVLG